MKAGGPGRPAASGGDITAATDDRRVPPYDNPSGSWLGEWRDQLINRRRCLLRLAGGSLAALFPMGAAANADNGSDADPANGPSDADGLSEQQRWQIIAAVQAELLPSETDAPGAIEVNALAYLRRVMAAPDHDPQERRFVLDGAGWLDDIARQSSNGAFAEQSAGQREQLLQRIAASEAGENWLSTLLVYLLEALLTDPIYGGNPGGVGWRWLQHTAGFPRPERPFYQMDFFRS